MSFSELISPLIGRWLLAWFFLSEFFRRAGNFNGTVQLMVSAHVPVPQLLLVLGLVVLALGGLSLLLGFHTRHGAMMLFGFTLIVSMLMHPYWNIANHIDRSADYEIFARNIAIAGGLLLLVGMGAGPFALDNRLGGKKKH
jgi:putative oxidoreductase